MEDARQALLFNGHRLADQVLHHRIAWHDDALLSEELEQLAEDIDWLAANLGELAGVEDGLLALRLATELVLEKFQDACALLEDGGLGESRLGRYVSVGEVTA